MAEHPWLLSTFTGIDGRDIVESGGKISEDPGGDRSEEKENGGVDRDRVSRRGGTSRIPVRDATAAGLWALFQIVSAGEDEEDRVLDAWWLVASWVEGFGVGGSPRCSVAEVLGFEQPWRRVEASNPFEWRLVRQWMARHCACEKRLVAWDDAREWLSANKPKFSLPGRMDVEAPAPSVWQDWRPVHWAAWRGWTRLLSILATTQPGEVTAVDGAGLTPLHLAALRGHTATVRWIARAGATTSNGISVNIDSRLSGARCERTALHNAVLHDRAETVTALLELGADAFAPDGVGDTPLMLAYDSGPGTLAVLKTHYAACGFIALAACFARHGQIAPNCSQNDDDVPCEPLCHTMAGLSDAACSKVLCLITG